MIHKHTGDLLDAQGIIVHGCNAHGVMGSGVAAQIKSRWPEAYGAYREHWRKQGLKLGDVICYAAEPEKIIANAITQEHFGADGKKYVDTQAVIEVFLKVGQLAEMFDLPINFPLIGCGLGGGNWERDIEPAIKYALDYFKLDGHLWVPHR